MGVTESEHLLVCFEHNKISCRECSNVCFRATEAKTTDKIGIRQSQLMHFFTVEWPLTPRQQMKKKSENSMIPNGHDSLNETH